MNRNSLYFYFSGNIILRFFAVIEVVLNCDRSTSGYSGSITNYTSESASGKVEIGI